MSNLSSTVHFKKTKRGNPCSAIESLPTDLLMEVLTRVASSSFSDLFSAKLSCKNFLKASEDESIKKKISIENFPTVPWWEVRDEVSVFMKACEESGNPEVLYRQGMMEFFSLKKVESGNRCLKAAMEMGHMEASYVYGIILLCKEGELDKEQGVKLLNAVKKSRKLGQCRKKTKDFILKMWIRNPISISQELADHHSKTCGKRNNIEGVGERRGGWPKMGDVDDEDDEDYCEACMLDNEVTSFCKLFR